MLKQLVVETKDSYANLFLNHVTIITVGSAEISSAVKQAVFYKHPIREQNEFQWPYTDDIVLLFKKLMKSGYYYTMLEMMNLAGFSVFNIYIETANKNTLLMVNFLNAKGDREKQELSGDMKMLFGLVTQILMTEEEKTYYIDDFNVHFKTIKSQQIYNMLHGLADVSLAQLIIKVKNSWFFPMMISNKMKPKKDSDKITLSHIGYYHGRDSERKLVATSSSCV